MKPTVQDVRDFSSANQNDSNDKVQMHLDAATAMVNAYTRGRGFDSVTGDPSDDLAGVIVAFAARSVDNPVGDRQQTVGAFGRTPAVVGWSLPELAVLNRYRAKAW